MLFMAIAWTQTMLEKQVYATTCVEEALTISMEIADARE
jgi:hypothetical protein